MKFKAEPDFYVRINTKFIQRMTGKKGLQFDSNGIYETENEVLIKVLSQTFEAVIDEAEVLEVEKIEPEMKKCKKCDFECENQGELLSHYRVFHAKNKEGK